MTSIVGYSSNDMYYVSSYCPTDASGQFIGGPSGEMVQACIQNKNATISIITNKNGIESAKEKYENMKDLYNREILHFFNMSLGIAGLMYYVYKNQDAVQNFFM